MATKRGIVLMNLGSPDSTSVKNVRRYLNEFLMDGKVIDVPYLLRFLTDVESGEPRFIKTITLLVDINKKYFQN